MKKIPKSIRPILQELKNRLKLTYDKRLKDIVLYGSYARGDFDAGSDIDVIVVLDGMRNACREILRCSAAIGDLELEYDTLISIIPVDVRDYRERSAPVILNAKKEGLSV